MKAITRWVFDPYLLVVGMIGIPFYLLLGMGPAEPIEGTDEVRCIACAESHQADRKCPMIASRAKPRIPAE